DAVWGVNFDGERHTAPVHQVSMSEAPPQSVLACIASDDNTVTVPIMQLMDALARDAPQSFALAPPVVGCRSIGAARNKLVQRFLATSATILWFIDADTLPSENTGKLFTPANDLSV